MRSCEGKEMGAGEKKKLRSWEDQKLRGKRDGRRGKKEVEKLGR
jgi:hypothetical protein